MTLARILEPELMDTEEDAEEYHAMDFSEPDGLFADAALRIVEGVASPEIADFGTGTAKIPVLMCERRSDLRVLALDPAREMLRVATRHVAERGLAGSITLARMDGRTTKLGAGRFHAIVSNSTIHHIHSPHLLFREMKRVLRPGGGVLIRDLLRPASMEAAWSIVKRVAAGDTMKQQQLFFDSLCAALTLDEVRAHLADVGWSDLQAKQVSDRHWSVERKAS